LHYLLESFQGAVRCKIQHKLLTSNVPTLHCGWSVGTWPCLGVGAVNSVIPSAPHWIIPSALVAVIMLTVITHGEQSLYSPHFDGQRHRPPQETHKGEAIDPLFAFPHLVIQPNLTAVSETLEMSGRQLHKDKNCAML